MKHLAVALALVLYVAPASAGASDDQIDKLLAQMTLEEKLGQISQYTGNLPEFSAALQKGLVGSMLNTGGAAETNEVQRIHMANSRLDLPILIGHDVIHGYRTTFPIPLAISSSWDPSLAELSAAVAAKEARAAGIHWTFAPMVDVARDARWGRIAEGSGEDPFLGQAMGAAYVRGFQSNRLLACAKHFVAYGAAEGGRDYDAAHIPERTLREVYLPPFRAAVDAGVATLMSSFNTIGGIPATANQHTLDEILRGEWKFDGFVVSDWDAIVQLIPHGVAGTNREAATKAILAGVDMAMHDSAYMTLTDPSPAVMKRIDESVRRVLRAKFRAGLFDSPFTSEAVPALNRNAARRVAQHSIVLLKNEGNLLPLAKTARRYALIGPLADSKNDMLGPWSAEGAAGDAVSVREALRAFLPEKDLLYARGSGINETSDEEIVEALEVARKADVTIAVLGESKDMSGEAASRSTLDLPGRQQLLLDALLATGKPIVLVVMSGRPLAISRAAERVPAIVQAWFLGIEAGNAIADVLFGDVNPSAKLTVTFPRTTGQVPIYYAHLPTGRPPDLADKFTSKYIDLPLGPLYPFGYGLSYTTFAYSNLKVSGMTVSADVKNTGKRAGDEIVQFYIHDVVASVSRPVRELKGFQRVSLAPGESKRVQFTLTRKDLEFWGENGWTTEPGTFKVWIAPDSQSGLEGELELK